MAHLSVGTMIEKNRINSDVAFLIAMEIDVIDPDTGLLVETLYLINNNEDISFQGNNYIATYFSMDVTAEAGSKPTLNVSASDHSRAIQARMQNYRGGIGFKVRVMIINSGNLSQPPEIMEHFTIIGASEKDYVVDFKLGAENPLARRFPFRLQFKDRCQWTYKGDQCRYAGGEATCDYTLQGPNGCAAHNNTLNFGAFPGIKPIAQ